MEPPVPSFDLRELLPKAVAWVAEQERRIILSAESVGLDAGLLAFAREIGVKYPERVRLLAVSLIPRPTEPVLHYACEAAGVLQGAGGLCMRYGIYINSLDLGDAGLIAHELVHTLQYERLGGIEPFVREYISQVLGPAGYECSSLEVEAGTLAARMARRGLGG